MTIRLSGMNSGLDTDSMVKELVSAYRAKGDKIKKKQIKLSWTQDKWKSINTNVLKFYKSLDSLRFASGYNLKKTTVSDTTKATVTASKGAPNGSQSLKISQLAKSGNLTGAKLNNTQGSAAKIASLAGGAAIGEGIFRVSANGVQKDIAISGEMKISEFVEKINTSGADVQASYDDINKRIFVSSKKSGAEGDFTLVALDENSAKAFQALGVGVASTTGSNEAEKWMAYTGDAVNEDGIVKIDTKGDTVTKLQDAFDALIAAKKEQSTAEANLKKAEEDKEVYEGAITYGKTLQEIAKVEGMLASKGDASIIGNSTASAKASILSKMVNDSSYIAKNYTYNSSTGEYEVSDTGIDGQKLYDELIKGIPEKIEKKEGDQTVKDSEDNPVMIENPDYTSIKNYGSKINAKTYYENDKAADGTLENDDVLRKYNEIISQNKTVADIIGEYEGLKTTNNSKIESSKAALATVTEKVDKYKALDSDQLTKILEDIDKTAKAETDATAAKTTATAAKTAASDAIDAAVAAGDDEAKAKAEADLTKAEADLAKAGADLAKAEADGNAAKKAKEDYFTTLQTRLDYFSTNYTKNTNGKYELNDANISEGALKVDGQDSKITLNGVEYTSGSNSFNINGLSITALATTGDQEITVTTATDTQGLYDKIKDFLTEYNAIIGEMSTQYSAASAKGYEPMTSEEKGEFSESEVADWEKKIKDSLLRRDNTLGSLITMFTSSMSSTVEIKGKTYSLADLGIKKEGYFTTTAATRNMYHIDGDADDDATSSKDDKLMAMLSSDPDTVIEIMKKVTGDLSEKLRKEMQPTSIRSYQSIYNDKAMATAYSDYTKKITEWEEKVTKIEESYYKKFAAMETALAKIQSQQSSLAGLLGS